MVIQAERINRWPIVISVAISGVLAVWPEMLLPVARAVTEFCERWRMHQLLIQYCPPYLVAFLGILALGAGCVTLAMLLRQIYGHHCLHQHILTRRRQPDAEMRDLLRQLRAEDRVVIFAASDRSAFCSGLVTPRAYISTGLIDLLERSELEAVLRHELHHVRQRDPLRLFLGRLVAVTGTLIPVLRVVAQRQQVRLELAADSAALSAIPIESLASALILVSRGRLEPAPPLATARFSITEARISALLGQVVTPRPRRVDIVLTGVVVWMLVSLSWWLTTLPLDHMHSCPSCPLFS